MEAGVTILSLKIIDYKSNKPEKMTRGATYTGKISLTADISLNDKLNQVIVRIHATLFLENDAKNLINLGQITSETIFSLSASAWNKRIKKESDTFIVNKDLDTYLIGVSYDSLRGLMRERGKDDLLGKAILPLVNPADITRVDSIHKK